MGILPFVGTKRCVKRIPKVNTQNSTLNKNNLDKLTTETNDGFVCALAHSWG